MRTSFASKMEETLETKEITCQKRYSCQNKVQKDNGFSKRGALVTSKKLLHGTKTPQQRVSSEPVTDDIFVVCSYSEAIIKWYRIDNSIIIKEGIKHLDTAAKLHIWTHCGCERLQKPSMEGRKGHGASPLAKELFTIDTLWERESVSSLRVWSLVNSHGLLNSHMPKSIWTAQIGLDWLRK